MRAEHVPGHQVGGELDAFEIELEDLADGPDQGGLAEAGQTFEQHVAAAQNADEHQAVKFPASKQNAVELFQDFADQVGGRLQFLRFENGVRHNFNCRV